MLSPGFIGDLKRAASTTEAPMMASPEPKLSAFAKKMKAESLISGGDMKSRQRTKNILLALSIIIVAALMTVATAQAQVPPDIAAQLRLIGTGVCVPETAKIYRPLQPKAPYPGVTMVRDISYAPDPRTVMDVFAPEKGRGNRPVLIFVSGGAGDKIVSGPDGDAFYDNIMLWAVKNGMTGVNMQRRGGFGGGLAWDDPAKDVGRVVEWVRGNIKKYKGNPNRIFLWADSAGNGPVSRFPETERACSLESLDRFEGREPVNELLLKFRSRSRLRFNKSAGMAPESLFPSR